MYFGTYETPNCYVIKIQKSPLACASTLALTEPYCGSSAYDGSQYGFFGTWTINAKVMKVDLAAMTQIGGAAALITPEDNLWGAAADRLYAYFLTYVSPGKVIKMQMSTNTKISTLTLTENSPRNGFVDPFGTFLMLTTDTNPDNLVAVRLATFTQDQVLPLLSSVDEQGAHLVVTKKRVYVTAERGGQHKLIVFGYEPSLTATQTMSLRTRSTSVTHSNSLPTTTTTAPPSTTTGTAVTTTTTTANVAPTPRPTRAAETVFLRPRQPTPATCTKSCKNITHDVRTFSMCFVVFIIKTNRFFVLSNLFFFFLLCSKQTCYLCFVLLDTTQRVIAGTPSFVKKWVQ